MRTKKRQGPTCDPVYLYLANGQRLLRLAIAAKGTDRKLDSMAQAVVAIGRAMDLLAPPSTEPKVARA